MYVLLQKNIVLSPNKLFSKAYMDCNPKPLFVKTEQNNENFVPLLKLKIKTFTPSAVLAIGLNAAT